MCHTIKIGWLHRWRISDDDYNSMQQNENAGTGCSSLWAIYTYTVHRTHTMYTNSHGNGNSLVSRDDGMNRTDSFNV